MSRRIQLRGPLTREHAQRVAAELDAASPSDGPLLVDLSAVTSIDSAGVALLAAAARRESARGSSLSLADVPPPIARTLDLFPFPEQGETGARVETPLLERLGEETYASWLLIVEYVVLCADVAWFGLQDLLRRKIRWSIVIADMSAMGSRALGVIGLIAFLVGATMALQSAVQLRQFGANIFVVDLVGISLTRELGPLMTAIVVAGRSGSAVAAELGTMVITEEIDALRTMGVHPTRFLVVPKAIAITLTQPLLTMFANALAIFGGFLVAVTYLEIGPDAFIQRLQEALYLKDLTTGLFKSVVFANIILTIGAICGFRTGGGADAVGRSTTAAVVASIFAVIVADAAFSLVFYFGE